MARLSIPLMDGKVMVYEGEPDELVKIGEQILARSATQTARPTDVAELQPSTGSPMSAGRQKPAQTTTDWQQFSPDAPPDLRHTRVLTALFDSRAASGWNKLVHEAHVDTFRRLRSLGHPPLEALRTVTNSNIIKGRPTSEEAKKGYHYIPEIDVSIQNVDAAHAWSNTLRLAKHLRVEVIVDFEWMEKSEATYPGKKGRLWWKPA